MCSFLKILKEFNINMIFLKKIDNIFKKYCLHKIIVSHQLNYLFYHLEKFVFQNHLNYILML